MCKLQSIIVNDEGPQGEKKKENPNCEGERVNGKSSMPRNDVGGVTFKKAKQC